ncbi:sensor histidine kinase [Aquimarina sp. MMG016]|nr:sensor histidine kinase [Aquimarina sp. MMG016]
MDEHINIINDTNTSTKLKIEAYEHICNVTFRKENKTHITYASQFIDFAIDIKEFDKATFRTLQLYDSYYREKEFDKGLLAVNKMLNYEDQLTISKDIAGLYRRLATHSYYKEHDFKKAIEYSNQAIAKYKPKDSIFINDAIVFRGQAYHLDGESIKAIHDYEKGKAFYERNKDLEGIARTNQNLAALFALNGFFKEAEEVNQKNLAYYLEKKNYYNAARIAYNMSLNARSDKKIDKQEEYILKAEKYIKLSERKINDVAGLLPLLASELYAKKGNLELAVQYIQKFDTLNSKIRNSRFVQEQYNLAKIYIEELRENYDVALSILKKQDTLYKGNRITHIGILHKKLYYKLYKAKGNNSKALKYLEKYRYLRDSMYSIQKEKALLYYQDRYESERKDRKIAKKEANILLLEKDNTIKNNLMIFGGIGLTLLFGFFYSVIAKLYADRKKKMQQNYSQNLILTQEQERKRIASELHDGVGQQLLLIKNQSILNDLDDIKNIANQTISEVKSILSDLHPYELKEFGLTTAIFNIMEKFEKNSSIFVSYEIENIDKLFNDKQQINIYRIIQESVNNIIKHSEATAARIDINKFEKHIQLIIKDNGKGYEVSEAYKSQKSIGLKTMQERINLLKGSMSINTQKNKGTQIEFLIPA